MSAALEVRELEYAYPDGTSALRGVSLRVDRGECVGLIGPNGAGKSTLLLHFNGLLPEPPVQDGTRVWINGAGVTRANLRNIRRQVGFVFQDANDQLFCPTVWEDVAYGPQQLGLTGRELDRRVHEALEAAGIHSLEKKNPHHLSGGEKRRACLAGVLACEPEILVLDEPTTGLDPRGRREFMALLRTLPQTKIIATHDLAMVQALCTRVILLDGGVVVADGATRRILADEALMLGHGLEVVGP